MEDRTAARSSGIGQDEWLRELERVQKRIGDKGQAIWELAEMWNVTPEAARRRVKALYRAGRIFVGRRTEMRMDGRPGPVPVYRLKKGEK